ncbi:lanthionine synthetase C family protein [Streptomyces klenkii]|uniref:lanthionine synthetase C family protein n=1 Tax=Streptomyces klenkii TaxID=1420899 RepID=UPI0034270EA5
MTAGQPWMAQSLANGAAGTALLHIERARTGQGTWQQAHSWITKAVAGEISAADATGLYLGAPAVAFILHAASTGSARYNGALKEVDAHVVALAHRRVDAALARIRRGELTSFAEYDVFSGLTGIGAYLLRSSPQGSAMERVLRYLVELTRPLRVDGQALPGWWVGHDQHTRTSARYLGGHSNQGAAHGITGPLLLLSQAVRHGVTVDGQYEAIETICAWFDAWEQHGQTGAWWPECVALANLPTGRPAQRGPARPSWCYGTPGIARAQQLAAIATGDTKRQHAAEEHFANCLSDPVQLGRLTDAGLCHGWAGVYQTVWRAARDAASPALRTPLLHLADGLARHAASVAADGHGFLDGSSGTALALMTAAQDTAPTSGWDACLLID